MRRLISSLALVALLASGLSVVVAEPAHAVDSYGTITGSVSFATAPSWDTAGKNFHVQLAYDNGYLVPSDLVPITYSYNGSGGFTITYPNDEDYYNDYFSLSRLYTIRISPIDPAYPQTYLGGMTLATATFFDLSLPKSTTAVGNTALPILASISGKVTFPGGMPSGGVQAVAHAISPVENSGSSGGDGIVLSDGTYHLVGLAPGSYNVGFIPLGSGSGPGAGIWWSSKPALAGAGVVTLTASQQRAGVNQSLPAGGIITGRLTDSEGRVVRGAVAIYTATGTSDSMDTLVQEKFVEWNGTYAFWGLPNGKYRVGFDTGVHAPIDSALELRNLDGSPRASSVPTVDIRPGYDGATDGDGSLADSTYPYASAWYTASAASYATAKNVTISTSVPMVGNVNGVLPLDPAFTRWQPKERISGSNAAEKDTSCPCADPVDTLSGEFSESHLDLAFPGAGVPVQLDRSYSAFLATVDGPFGFGSSSSLTAHLEEVPGTEQNPFGTVVVTQESGATVTFTTLSPRQEYLTPSRVNATLRYDRSDDEWVFTRNALEEFRFTEGGALLSHRDLHDTLVTYGSDESGHVTAIEGSGGRVITIAWDGDHIVSATDSAGRTVGYDYSGGELTSFTAADGRVTAFEYDSDHRVTTITAPGGGVTTNVYDQQGRVTSQTDPLGRVTTLSFAGDAADATTTVTNPAGVASTYHYVGGALVSRTDAFGTTSAVTTTLSYDVALNVVKQVNALNKATTMTYDDAGNMLTVTDPLGHTTTYEYDTIHDVISVTDAIGRVSTATYDSTGSKTSATSPNGGIVSWTFNADGTPASSTDPLGQTTTFAYDAAGLPVSKTDPLGRVTVTGYDAAGHLTSTTDATGATSSMTVDPLGRTLTATDALGNTTTYGYDDYGNQTSVTDPDGRTTTAAFDLGNQVVSQTDALGHTATLTYTPLGKPATTTDPLGAVTTTAYDLLGRPTVVTDPKNLKTTTTYNKNDQVVQVRSPAGNITKASYDVAGRQVTSTDALGNVTAYAYDAADQLVSVTDPLGRVTSTSYDLDGRRTTLTGPDGHTETMAYDLAGQRLAFTDADGNTTAYTYDEAGQATTRTAPGGLVTSYGYDDAGRVTSLTKPDATTVENVYSAIGQLLSSTPTSGIPTAFTYDAVGRRASMSDETGTTSYHYSAIGQLTSVTNGAGLSISYAYDQAGRTTSLGYPGGKTVTYAYDADGRMTSLTDWANRKFSFTWTSDSMPAKTTDPNKVATTTTYNKNNQVTAITIAKTSAPTATLATYQYGYDAASQLTSTTLSDPLHAAVGGEVTGYGYDPRQQLTSVSTGGSYASTAAGSLTQTPGSTITYNTAQQVTSIESTITALRSDFGYDGNGARASQETTTPGGTTTTTYAHTWQGSLASVTTPTTTVSYTTSGDGLRQSRTTTTGTEQLLWDTSTNIPLLLKDGAASYLYGPALTPVAEIDNSGDIRYLHTDNLGSVRLVTTPAAAVAATTDYSPYGTATTTGTASRFGYAQSWTDPTTKLDYLRAREYDPATGQFLQTDPAQETTRQPYAYARNNPLGATDPTGLGAGDPWSAAFRDLVRGILTDPRVVQFTQHPGDQEGTLRALGFDRGADGHFSSTANPWQLDWGYQDLYDMVFAAVTPMKASKATFMFGKRCFILWGWKGDYLNLGAGAEIGFYSQDADDLDERWDADKTGYIPKMTMNLQDPNGKEIADFAPDKAQIWVAGWNPYVQGASLSGLFATMTVDFSDNSGMFDAFSHSSDAAKKGWMFDPAKRTGTLKFRRRKLVR